MNNSTDQEGTDISSSRMNLLTYLEAVCLSVICFVSLTGNLSLFFIVFRTRSLQTTSNCFTLNLACADILVSSVSMPVTVYTIVTGKRLLGDAACTAMGFVTILSFIASVMSLALIAINRYFYIVHWKSYFRIFKRPRVIVFIACDWLLSIGLSSPPLLGWSRFGYIQGKSYCFVDWPADVNFMYFMIIICFFGPLVTMAICYTKILLFTRNAKRKVLGDTAHAPASVPKTNLSWFSRGIVSREEAKITNTLLIVLAAFLLCWAPFAITMFFDVYYPFPLPRAVNMGSLLLGYLNSLCNPIIYAVRNQKFRIAYTKLYSMCFPCLKTRRDETLQGESTAQRPAVLMSADANTTHTIHA